MKIKIKHKITTEIPSASQADIAFLLIIFFIVTVVFLQNNFLVFNLPANKKSATVSKINIVFISNQELKFNNKTVSFSQLEKKLKQSHTPYVIIFFTSDLKYKRFISLFQILKKFSNIKISLKPYENKKKI